MFAFLRRVIDLLTWWIVVIACVAFIGYIAWPLLADKFYSLCSNNSQWRLCHANWNAESSADIVQNTIESKTSGFFAIGKTAVSDVFSDDGGKKKVIYKMNDQTGIFMPVEIPVSSKL